MTEFTQAQAEEIMAEYPRWPGEGGGHYMQRVLVIAGIIERHEASLIASAEDIQQRDEPAEVRLPYKDAE